VTSWWFEYSIEETACVETSYRNVTAKIAKGENAINSREVRNLEGNPATTR